MLYQYILLTRYYRVCDWNYIPV